MRRIVGLLAISLAVFSCQENEWFAEESVNTELMTRASGEGFSNDTVFNIADFNIHGKTRMQTEKVFTRVPFSYYSDGDKASVKLNFLESRNSCPSYTMVL